MEMSGHIHAPSFLSLKEELTTSIEQVNGGEGYQKCSYPQGMGIRLSKLPATLLVKLLFWLLEGYVYI
jgi:hypothetical protein